MIQEGFFFNYDLDSRTNFCAHANHEPISKFDLPEI